MHVKYEMCITRIGRLVDQFLSKGILVFFQEGAPDELAEFSILHTHSDLKENIHIGDHIVLCDKEFTITGVGDVANKNLGDLGHLILKNNGLRETELPGDISVEREPFPDICLGNKVKLFSVHDV
ncbi:MAG: PTS glucitol/sorbitol transporter subunit IIA [Chloroflexi bacterium]|jgi:PTS system glucitol/sorbitol-specific IIA component|nr:PTS glucitol/sorbitol transporter subunit IIA [Chloroflexota bacterium]